MFTDEPLTQLQPEVDLALMLATDSYLTDTEVDMIPEMDVDIRSDSCKRNKRKHKNKKNSDKRNKGTHKHNNNKYQKNFTFTNSEGENARHSQSQSDFELQLVLDRKQNTNMLKNSRLIQMRPKYNSRESDNEEHKQLSENESDDDAASDSLLEDFPWAKSVLSNEYGEHIVRTSESEDRRYTFFDRQNSCWPYVFIHTPDPQEQ